MGALSKLDEFLLNPQVWTCSVAVPGTSRNNNSENRETFGDRSSDDPCPELRYSSHHSGHLNNPEAEGYPHNFQESNQSYLILYMSLFYFNRSSICRPSIRPEKPLWSGSNTLATTVRPEDALADFMAISTLAITKLQCNQYRVLDSSFD